MLLHRLKYTPLCAFNWFMHNGMKPIEELTRNNNDNAENKFKK